MNLNLMNIERKFLEILINKIKNIQKQLDFIYDEFMNYIIYVNEKYYRNGFVDGVQLITGSMNS